MGSGVMDYFVAPTCRNNTRTSGSASSSAAKRFIAEMRPRVEPSRIAEQGEKKRQRCDKREKSPNWSFVVRRRRLASYHRNVAPSAGPANRRSSTTSSPSVE
jgi:hypothetical protein